jgi:glyoxylase-like metal-dependent hydrolase (beta-lactamase superfamily II)
MELREVASGVYACLQPDRGWGWSNSGFVARGGGLVVDTLMDVRSTRRALDLYAGVAAGAPRRLVNTHHNVDHTWGNQLLRDAEIYGHRFCAEAMTRDLPPQLLEAMRKAPDLPPGQRWFADDVSAFDFSDVEVTPPNRLVGDEGLTLDLDGRPAELIFVGPAHTGGDLVVHLPEDGVVFAGDVLFHHCTPIGWEGTTERWCEALERIASLAPLIVPGHGVPCGPEAALELRDYLRYVLDESRRFFEQEIPAEEAARRIDLGPYADWTQPERLVFNVERAYRELRGGSWDESVDALPLFEAAVRLRRHWDEQARS